MERLAINVSLFHVKPERFLFPGPLFLALLFYHATHITILDMHSQRSSRSSSNLLSFASVCHPASPAFSLTLVL